MKIYYNPDLKDKASELRKNATFAERVLWKHLRNRQLCGYQFMRQKPIDNYIVDFYCSKLSLVIEINGITHNDKQQYDMRREKRLKELGLKVMNFNGYYVINNINETIDMISDKVLELQINLQPPTPFIKGD